MATSHTVALLGFSAFERSTLETCFRLSLQREQSYTLAGSIEGSELLIADCDQPDVLRSVGNAGRMQDTVFVGVRQPPGSAGAPATPDTGVSVMDPEVTRTSLRPTRLACR